MLENLQNIATFPKKVKKTITKYTNPKTYLCAKPQGSIKLQ